MTSSVAATPRATLQRDGGARRRVARLAAGSYPAVWIAGLAIAPPGPDPLTATASELHVHAASHGAALVAQSTLVHGLAGLALLTLALLLPGRLGNVRSARSARVSGVVAAVGSLAQTGLMLRIVGGVSDDTAATTAEWFRAIDRVDSVKLFALGTTVALFTWSGRHLVGRGLVVLGVLLAVLLPVSGAAFVGADALYPLLYLSLPLLLIWVPWFVVATTRPTARPGR